MKKIKNIEIYDKCILDCFGSDGYSGEIIGVYEPNSLNILDFIIEYRTLGLNFMIYKRNKNFKDIECDVPIETDFKKFYNKTDIFVIESIIDFKPLYNDLDGMFVKVFIVN